MSPAGLAAENNNNNNNSLEETTGTALLKARSLSAGMVRQTEPREILSEKHNVAGAGQGHGQPENKPSGAIEPVQL